VLAKLKLLEGMLKMALLYISILSILLNLESSGGSAVREVAL